MLSRAQETRVREILFDHPPGIILREHGACPACDSGLCDTDAHETGQVLIWGSPTPTTGQYSEPDLGGGHAP